MPSPLADRMRPQKIKDIIGQKHLLAEDKLLYRTIAGKKLFSMILWGPPGVGKTTIARVIANEIEADFMEFSAVTASIAEIKKIFADLSSGRSLFPDRQTVVFIDEIHRFNKAQQDAFLPYVERGDVVLIGATTENPSFEIIAPLLSRSKVFVLEQLSENNLKEIVNNALKDKANGLGNEKIKINPDALDFLILGSSGDSRYLLNTLEIAVSITNENTKKEKVIDKEIVAEALQQRVLLYDKSGDEHYNVISAFIKSMRASNIDAALYYLARMVKAGEDPLFIARRMVIFASEDIGMAQPTALVVANEVFKACEVIGYPECQINLAHGVVYLASAKKGRSSYEAYFKALEDVEKNGNLPIPLKIRNAPTKLMKELDYGKGYEKYSKEDMLPEKIKGSKYYNNSEKE